MRARTLFNYALLLALLFGFVGLNFTGIGGRLHRISLESKAIVAEGTVVDHLIYKCSGIRCAEKTQFRGDVGSQQFEQFMEDCGSGRRYRCHTDLLVRFDHDGKTYDLTGQVERRDVGAISQGDRMPVLIDPADPSRSLLRDYDPEGFLFYIAIAIDALLALGALIILGHRRRRRGIR